MRREKARRAGRWGRKKRMEIRRINNAENKRGDRKCIIASGCWMCEGAQNAICYMAIRNKFNFMAK